MVRAGAAVELDWLSGVSDAGVTLVLFRRVVANLQAGAAMDAEPEWVYFKPPKINWNDEKAIEDWAHQVWEHLKAGSDVADDADDPGAQAT